MITTTRRLTSPFFQALPANIKRFDGYMYAEVLRKPSKMTEGKFGKVVRIEPAILRLQQGILIINIPTELNEGIQSIDDLDDSWLESIQAAFLHLIISSI
jgi:hypothetical protein